MVHIWEDQKGYSWRKFLPILKVAYFPYYSKESMLAISSNDRYAEMLKLCIEMCIFSLQVMLTGETARKMMVEQGLMEYVICLPSVLPENSNSKQRASNLVSMLGNEMHLQPPSLNVMARARLAVTYCGLEKAMKTSVQELLSEIHPTT